MAGIAPDPSLATRRSLITRLKNWDDQEGWRDFFQIYWKLIYCVATKSGLTNTEAEDVVQETVTTVAKTMGSFRYDPRKCRFKTWLMRITRMRIVDQFRKRGPEFQPRAGPPQTTGRTATVERIPDPAPPLLDAVWDEEWQKNLVDAAMDRVKRRVKPEHYQIFYLSAVKNLGTVHVARTIGVSAAQVYLVKHRVAAQVRKEIHRLEKESDRQAQEAWTTALPDKTKSS